MGTHARYSPSKLPSLKKCLGFVSDDTPGPAAMRGTAIHGLIADFIGKHKNSHDKKIPIPLDEVASRGCEMYLDLCDQYPELIWSQELFVDTGIADVSGTADLVGCGAFSTFAVVVDWKTGGGTRPNAAENLQMQAYAIGVIRAHPAVERVICIMGELEQEPTQCEYTRAELDAAAAKISCLTAMADTATPADWSPNPYSCKYCARKPCSAMAGEVATIATSVAPAKTKAGVAAAVATMDPVDVAAALEKFAEKAELVEQFMESVRERAKTMIEHGIDVPGWALKERATSRKWSVGDDRILQIGETYGVDCKDVASPATVEKRLTEKHGKAKAKEIVDGIAAKGVSKTLVKVEGKK